MWQATPSPATATLSQMASWSQSVRTSLTSSTLPLSSPFFQSLARERLQKWPMRVSMRGGQGLGVHPSEHQHLARGGIRDDGGDQAVGIELGGKGKAALDLGLSAALGEQLVGAAAMRRSPGMIGRLEPRQVRVPCTICRKRSR